MANHSKLYLYKQACVLIKPLACNLFCFLPFPINSAFLLFFHFLFPSILSSYLLSLLSYYFILFILMILLWRVMTNFLSKAPLKLKFVQLWNLTFKSLLAQQCFQITVKTVLKCVCQLRHHIFQEAYSTYRLTSLIEI